MKSKTTTKKEATRLVAKALVEGIDKHIINLFFDSGLSINKKQVTVVSKIVLETMNNKKYSKSITEQAMRISQLRHDEVFAFDPF